MTTQTRIKQRRREFYDLRISGVTLAETVKIIGKKYGVKDKALYRDWKQRSKWGDYVQPEEDDRFIVQLIIAQVDTALSDLRSLYNDEETPVSERRRILSKIADILLRKLEALQSLGKVYSEPVPYRDRRGDHASEEGDGRDMGGRAVRDAG